MQQSGPERPVARGEPGPGRAPLPPQRRTAQFYGGPYADRRLALLHRRSMHAAVPTTPGACQATARHAGACLLVRLAPGGRRLDYATYWGRSVNLLAASEGLGSGWVLPGTNAVAVEKKGDAYIAGDVLAEFIPAVPGAYQSDLHAR